MQNLLPMAEQETRSLSEDYRELGEVLGLSHQAINSITMASNDSTEARVQVLKKWISANKQASYKSLEDAIKQVYGKYGTNSLNLLLKAYAKLEVEFVLYFHRSLGKISSR